MICTRGRQYPKKESVSGMTGPNSSPSATRYSFSIGIHHVTLWTAFLFSYHVPVFIFSSSSFFLHVHHLFQSLSMYTSYTSSVKVHECFLVLSDSRNQMICNFEGDKYNYSVRFREFNLVSIIGLSLVLLNICVTDCKYFLQNVTVIQTMI